MGCVKLFVFIDNIRNSEQRNDLVPWISPEAW